MPQKNRKRAKAGYMISAVAEIYKLHPQTLRLYERVGLLKPSRSQGNTRLYTDSDLERLDVILTLARDMGVNLAGIEIILNMREKMIEMEHQMAEFRTSFSRSSPASRTARRSLVRKPPSCAPCHASSGSQASSEQGNAPPSSRPSGCLVPQLETERSPALRN